VDEHWSADKAISKKLKSYRRPHFFEEIEEIKKSLSETSESDLETLELKAQQLLMGEEILLKEIRSLPGETEEIKKLIDQSSLRMALALDLANRITKEKTNRLIKQADAGIENALDEKPPILFDDSQMRRNYIWTPPSRPVIEPK